MILERSVEIAGRTVRYLEAGTGQPLVLLHAFPLSADMWRPQLAAPPEGWRLLAPDLRGLGPAGSAAAATLSDMARDVAGWLDALRVDRAAIGGLSMGGYVTFALFRMAPERFTSIILANTKATADTAEGRAARDTMSALVRAGGPPAVAGEMIPKLLGRTSRESRPRLAATLRSLIEVNSTDGIDGAIQAMKGRPDSTDLLQRIGRPTLVIAGEEDVLIPLSESEAMHRLLPRSSFVPLPRSGHLSSLETPEDFSEALAGFLRANT
jgi:pimeloyl-ACP methyl ester carboxylesterase